MKHTVYFSDSRQMSMIPDESVQLIITSPPYWQLKDYGIESQIGFNDSYEDYINNLNLVWKECNRVLSKGCRLCINIGDQFARAAYYGRYKVIPIRTEIIRFCETLGLDYMGAIIWQKATTMHTSGGGAVMGSFPYPRNGILKIDYEFILIFKKQGISPKPTKEQKELSKLSKEEWNTYFASHWYFPGVKQDKHLAMFPEELPHRLIKMFSFVGETILDPFAGSGTTLLAAKNLNRNSIGIEINSEFQPIIEEKLGYLNAPLFDDNIQIQKVPSVSIPPFSSLPYVFHDPIKINKNNSIRKNSYGSKISMKQISQQSYYTVKKILSPSLLLLNNDKCIRLIGVKDNPSKIQQAINFLAEKFNKHRIFLRSDPSYMDTATTPLLRYVYLDNKTFINNHLIRTGYVDVDMDHNYHFKSKFIDSFPNT